MLQPSQDKRPVMHDNSSDSEQESFIINSRYLVDQALDVEIPLREEPVRVTPTPELHLVTANTENLDTPQTEQFYPEITEAIEEAYTPEHERPVAEVFDTGLEVERESSEELGTLGENMESLRNAA
jgi:hypothetical protein